MSPAMFAKLQKAADAVNKALADKLTPAAVIDMLIKEHGAGYGNNGQTYQLRVAAVSASCTWSRDEGLLNAWRKNATLRIVRERGGSE